MLTLTIKGDEMWDDDAEKFVYGDDVVLQFEHSLVALSKWEAKHHKLFLNDKGQSEEEMVEYIEAMLVTPDVSPETLDRLTEEHAKTLVDYVNDPMTGTIISNMPQPKGRVTERLSSELIYFWMSQFQIDKDCENWHLNRLFTLIKVHHAKSQKPQKMSKQKQVQSMAELNAARKKQLGTSG